MIKTKVTESHDALTTRILTRCCLTKQHKGRNPRNGLLLKAVPFMVIIFQSMNTVCKIWKNSVYFTTNDKFSRIYFAKFDFHCNPKSQLQTKR